MIQAAVPPMIAGLASIASRYDLILCDVWGVVHNGVAAFPEAVAALERVRMQGATVILISNAPRPGAVIRKQLDGLRVPHGGAYDTIIASGDVTREELAKRPGVRLYHLGPERDHPNYDGLDLKLVALEEAELVVCTGLFDDNKETPDDYRDMLARIRERGLPMICANPDIVVERGDRLIWCAGALAERYAALGGEVVYAGKPYASVYQSALAQAARIRGSAVGRERVLAIGDGVRTDLLGAVAQGFDTLFVFGGIHAVEVLDERGELVAERLAHLFAEAGAWPAAVIKRLAW
jgi:HAD superfamily hydrolase (TIGR01459 family)